MRKVKSRHFAAMTLAALCVSSAALAGAPALKDLPGAVDRGGGKFSFLGAGVPTPAAPSPAGGEFAYVDPGRVVPGRALANALNYYKSRKASIRNPRYLTIADFTQSSRSKRLYVIDMRTGKVERYLVAHGSGSDPRNTGYATVFSDSNGTHTTSLGFYRTGETYTGAFGYSMRLQGLSPTNARAASRAIVLHGWTVIGGSMAATWGCLGVEKNVLPRLILMLKGGSIIYAYHERFSR